MAVFHRKWVLQLHRQDRFCWFVPWLVWGVLLPQAAFAELPRGSTSAFALAGTPNLTGPAPLDLSVNPALSFNSSLTLEGIASRLYEMSDFDIAAGAAVFSRGRISFGLAAAQLVGLDYYAERSLLFAVSIAPHRRWRFGFGFEQQRIEFAEGYGNLSMLAISFGTLINPNDRLWLGGSVGNINRPRFDRQDEPLPLYGLFAAAYQATPSVTIILAHHLNERYPGRFSLGQQWAVVEDLDLLFGLETEPLEISGGFSLKLRGFNFEYAYRNNVYLGGTHRVGLRFSR